jgi:TonB-linked SusC/RagA family outer membrane protein
MRYNYYFSFIVAMLFSFGALAQVTVKGTVTSKEDNSPLPGVTVVLKNTTRGTVTDINGKYEIQADSLGQEIVFSFIGMKTVVMRAGSGPMNIQMEQGVQLDEVVVTALGIEKEKKALGYSVTEIQGDEVSNSGEANAIQGLAGKVAGVQVVGSSGTPGASSKVIIRGPSSFTGEVQPLIVIDGVPVNNDTYASVAGDYPFNENLTGAGASNRMIDLNPEDIESVSVLKGPAAAALYGVRGSNGVILYTTKKGRATGSKGRGFSVDYHLRYTLSEVNKLPKKQYKYGQGSPNVNDPDQLRRVDYITNADGDTISRINFINYDNVEYNTYDGSDGFLAGDLGTSSSWGPEIGKAGTDGAGLTAYPDAVDDFFQTGQTVQHDISVAGFNEKGSFRLSFGDMNDQGIIPNSRFRRSSFRLNTVYNFDENFSMGANFNYIYSRSRRVQNGSNLSGVMLSLMRNPASFDPMGGNSSYGYKYDNGTPYNYFYVYDNPYWTVYENPYTDNVNRYMINLNPSYKITNWLTLSDRFGIDIYDDSRQQQWSLYSWDPAFGPDGQVDENRLRNREIYNDLLATLNGNLTSNGDFQGNLVLGFNTYFRSFDDLYSRGGVIAVPNFYNLNNFSELYTSRYTEEQSSYALFFNGEVSYKSMLYLNVTGRNEWHSTFGPAKNNFFYPSASLSWIFTEILEKDWIDFGKLRLAYAEAGNAPSPYFTRTIFASKTFTDGFTDGVSFPYLGQSGFGYSATVGNQELKPERTVGFEIGTELRFFGNRLYTDVNYYDQTSKDLLVLRPVAESSGYSAAYTNAGEMRNWGWEILLGGQPVRTKSGFTWNVELNWAQNRNEVLSLVDGVDEIQIEAGFASISPLAIVGQPNGAFYGTAWQRDGSGNLIINPNTGLPLITPTQENIGNPWPEWFGGFRNTFAFKGFTLSALLDVRQGGDIWNGTWARMNRLGTTDVSEDRERNYVIEGVLAATDADGDVILDENGNAQGTEVKNTQEIDGKSYYEFYRGDAGAVENAIQDGSWVRLREVTLSYRLPISEPKYVLKYVEAYFTARNLWLSTDYTGVDPETSLTGAGSNIQGFDYFNNPGTRSYIFGLKLGL